MTLVGSMTECKVDDCTKRGKFECDECGWFFCKDHLKVCRGCRKMQICKVCAYINSIGDYYCDNRKCINSEDEREY